jgi:hypothetical protein
MQVAQRGTSQTVNGYGSLDRWEWNKVSSAGTMSQQTFTVGSEIDGQKNYLSFDITTGDNFTGFRTHIEGVRSVPSGSQYTVSFWARGTNPGASNVRVRMIHNFGSSGSGAVEPSSRECSLTSTWTKYTYTFTAPDYTGKTISGGNDFVALVIEQRSTDTSTDAWNMDITSVQLEVGSVATPFEHRSYGEELALCQRYYNRIGGESKISGIGSGVTTGTASGWAVINYPVTMRTSPTVSLSGGITLSTGTAYPTTPTLGSVYSNTDAAMIAVSYSSAVYSGGGQGAVLYTQNGSDDYVSFDAEL